MSILTYNGQSFKQREDGFVNLGQLCSTHCKQFSDWFRLKSAKEYLTALAETLTGKARGICVADDLVIKTTDASGGIGATWGHPLVAIEVARWIKPAFGVWCNIHIKQLMEKGETRLTEQPELPTTYLDALKQLVSKVEENEKLEKENKALTYTCHSLKEEIVEKEPLVQLAETLVVNDKDTVNIHEFAQAMNMSRNKMFDKLREIKFIQQKPSRIPYQKHLDAKRAEVYRKPRQYQPGQYDTVTVLTAKGQEYICKKLKDLDKLEKTEVIMEAVLSPEDF